MVTKNGIEYNLHVSTYKCTWRGFEFFFSSPSHLRKFRENIDKRVEWLNDSMSRRFHYNVELDPLAVFQLYNQVETRGFLVHDMLTNRWYECEETITFRGIKVRERD